MEWELPVRLSLASMAMFLLYPGLARTSMGRIVAASSVLEPRYRVSALNETDDDSSSVDSNSAQTP